LATAKKPKLDPTKPSTGPHGGRGLDIAGIDVFSSFFYLPQLVF